jgi:hypothetical protein
MTTIEATTGITFDETKEFVSKLSDPYCVFQENGTYEEGVYTEPYKQFDCLDEEKLITGMSDVELLLKLKKDRLSEDYKPEQFLNIWNNVPWTNPVQKEEVVKMFERLKDERVIESDPSFKRINLVIFAFNESSNEYYKEALKRPLVLSELNRLQNNAKLLKNVIDFAVKHQFTYSIRNDFNKIYPTGTIGAVVY